ncbi:unnamed protein product [Adineta ricciae]|uniref:Uncharacterized protein n=1 Tax=Adineta ricciae TaxID=249248 RepID=A0A815BS56_ADIRI|nr:unnamed protein product [Adineta ricciae]
MGRTSKEITIAFALNIGAGLATCIGGLVPFSRKLISLAKPSRIGIALALSAGVMIFISLAEIFGKSDEEFQKFFGKNATNICQNLTNSCQDLQFQCANRNVCNEIRTVCQTFTNETSNEFDCDKTCRGHSKTLTTVFFLLGAALIFLLDFIVHKISPDHKHDIDIEEINHLNHQAVSIRDPEDGSNSHPNGSLHHKKAHQSLNRTGILTALAIGLHNLPEGIATFLAASINLKTAVPLALGIALHNIPEGIAVATPVYFATQSKWKGLLYTFISALAEPLGGLICFLIISNGLNPFVNGAMFGIVVGMMVTISLKELIPTALRFCTSKGQISVSVLAGMLIMALSLIIFDYLGME